MPEIAEVEYFRFKLEKLLVGKKIQQVKALESGNEARAGLFDDLVFDKRSILSREVFVKALKGKIVTAVCRKGKYLWWELCLDTKSLMSSKVASPEQSVLFHFGMTGSFITKGELDRIAKSIEASPARKSAVHNNTQNGKDVPLSWPPSYTKCEFILSDKTRVAFRDPRRLGRILLQERPLLQEPLNQLARDPYSDMPEATHFVRCISKSTSPVKALLLDQKKVVCGLGNWLADEILFQAEIHPLTAANTLTTEQIKVLHQVTCQIVSSACNALKSGMPLPLDWLFHHRWGKRKAKGGKEVRMSTKKGDFKVEYVTVAGRTSAIIPELQKKPNTSDSFLARDHAGA